MFRALLRSTVGHGKSFLVCGVWICTTLGSPAGADELLVNGDAETGDLTGWTASGVQIAAVTAQGQQEGTVTPQEGTYFFTFAVTQGTFEELVQSGTDSLPAGTTVTLSGWVQTEDKSADDFGIATIQILDAGSQVIASTSSPALTTGNLVWQPFQVQLVVPQGAVSWKVVLSGTRVFGTFINVFYDAVSLDRQLTAPVPALSPTGLSFAAAILLLCGLAVIRKQLRRSLTIRT
jgi:hypothetical protein